MTPDDHRNDHVGERSGLATTTAQRRLLVGQGMVGDGADEGGSRSARIGQ
jgi:hypothetical protein